MKPAMTRIVSPSRKVPMKTARYPHFCSSSSGVIARAKNARFGARAGTTAEIYARFGAFCSVNRRPAMNRTLSLAAILMLSAPLFAADPKPVSTNAQQPAQEDSPLVAAAKKSGRLGKKPGYVITNDNLVTKGGHFTTTASQSELKSATTPVQGIQVPEAKPASSAEKDAAKKAEAE